MSTLKKCVQRILEGQKTSLLGIGPMSDNVLVAAIEAARELKFPPIIIASRNQIGTGGGYVNGWNQSDLVNRIERIASQVEYEGPLFICRDHGGPWQKDDEYAGKIPSEKAMEIAKESFLDDMKAGFNFLHVDPTKDPHSKADIDTVIERTVELITDIEDERKRLKIDPVEYEVGTEEIHGGLIDSEAFEGFIVKLNDKLLKKHLPEPVFIVGQTGTLLKMRENVGEFDESGARELCRISGRYGLGFKEHNADYLSEKILRIHPEIGITAINVAPEFGHVETLAYLEAGRESGYLHFEEVLKNAVISSGKWKKWLKDPESVTPAEIMKDQTLANEVTIVNGHYFFSAPEIEKEKKGLERKYSDVSGMSLDRFAIDQIKGCISGYVKALNLEGFNN